MTISAVTSNSSPAVDDLTPTADVSSTSAATTATTTKTARGHHHHHGSAKVSEMGQMMSKLQSLATGNPDEFKTLTSSIADKLTVAAQQASGDEATRLSDLAKKFQAASDSGTTDALQPSRPAPHQPYADAGVAPPQPSAQAKQTFEDIFALVKNA